MSTVRPPSSLTPPSSPRVGGKRQRDILPVVAKAIADLAPKKRGNLKKRTTSPIQTPVTGKRKRESKLAASSTNNFVTSFLGTIGLGSLSQSLSYFSLPSFISNFTFPSFLTTENPNSPNEKIASWKTLRSPGGTAHVTPEKDLKPLLRNTDNAVYAILQKDANGEVIGVYAGSVAKSGDDVINPNNVRKRFSGYKSDINNEDKNRPVIEALRTSPSDIIVYREVEGDEEALHAAEAALIKHLKEKYPNAKILNVTDPLKEGSRTKGNKKASTKVSKTSETKRRKTSTT